MSRVAIPTEDDRLCSHFGHCSYFSVFNITDNTINSIDKIVPPPHQPGVLPGWLAEQGITDIIAGGMGQRAIDLFNNKNVNVIIGASVVTPQELINDFLSGNLQTTENSCNHDDENHNCSH